ncbi:unnamed protein product [Arabis nemorensis]|uniref:Zinc knuckle CX2CX4HX4C domain-containing protein n=1 Tax=Arabis nemorensis TaxID=586526 RepID=A0A565BBY9_9BRAS|nr:unnamed protein product [Arabis nemorensis]
MDWKVIEPYPLVRVMVECDAPLIRRRETVSDTGELIVIRFEYLKIQNFCKRCQRLSHDTRVCPERVGAQKQQRDSHRDLNQRRDAEEDRRRRKAPRA